jgi:hypothetical protein
MVLCFLCLCFTLVIVWFHFQNWAFVARFCLMSEKGQLEYMIEYDVVSLAHACYMMMFLPQL